jgi:hypothetical protein
MGLRAHCNRRHYRDEGGDVIIPTPEFDPLFTEDGIPFRTKMTEYIMREFADLLGPRIGLLQSDEGLKTLAGMYPPEESESTRRKAG